MAVVLTELDLSPGYLRLFDTLPGAVIDKSAAPRGTLLAANTVSVPQKAAANTSVVEISLTLAPEFTYQLIEANFAFVAGTDGIVGQRDVAYMRIKYGNPNTRLASALQFHQLNQEASNSIDFGTGTTAVQPGYIWNMKTMPNHVLKGPEGLPTEILAVFSASKNQIDVAGSMIAYMLFNVYDLLQENAYPLHMIGNVTSQ